MSTVLVVGDADPDLVLRDDVVPRFGQAEQRLDDAALRIGDSVAITAHGFAPPCSLPSASSVSLDTDDDPVHAWHGVAELLPHVDVLLPNESEVTEPACAEPRRSRPLVAAQASRRPANWITTHRKGPE